MKNCFCCGKSIHKFRDCLNVRVQDKGSGKAQESGSNEASKKNCINALRSRVEHACSPDVVDCMLKIFSINVYAFRCNFIICYSSSSQKV